MELLECSEGDSRGQVQFIVDQLKKEEIEEPLSDDEIEPPNNQGDVCDMEIDQEIINHGIPVGETLLASEFGIGTKPTSDYKGKGKNNKKV